MKRLATLGSWKRLGLQAGLLSGLGLAFVAAPETVDAGERDCVIEGDCTFKKPNLMIIVDYSSSMNSDFGATTRWDATVDAIVAMIDADNGFLGDNLNLGLMRFGHDGGAGDGSLIAGDTSNPPITDGQALDVHWFDNSQGAADTDYVECNGEAIKDAIQAVPPPLCNTTILNPTCFGIGTWTKGALDFSEDLIAESQSVHGEAPDDRVYLNLVLTDGRWSNQDGTSTNPDPAEDPSITAAALFASASNVSTYVVAVAADQALIDLADELAVAGGTMQAIDGSTPAILVTQLQGVVQSIKDDLIQPECVGGMPRVMVILDASSSMINDGNTHASTPGDSGWDQAGAALGGANSIFDIVLTSGNTVEDLSQLGVLVFGAENPAEEQVLVDYGPCMKDNFAWALDPNNSCIAPGCTDPYAGPTIDWTSQDGSVVAPMFDVPTISHMPQCGQGDPGDTRCLGSGTYSHRGLELASSNQLAYHAAATMPGAEFPAGPGTTYINILITDGDYSSPSIEVENSLVEMYNRGITTYVIGFGGFGGFVNELNEMQGWGSGGTITNAFTAANQAQLQAELETILNGLSFDACCGFNDCSMNPEPTTNEPDPDTGSGTTAGDGDGDGDGSTSGDGDGDGDGSTSGDGDGDSTSGDGDGDSTSGDGDGDSTSGDGDGDSTSGDGDGDSTTTGDGDGDGDGDSTGSGEAGSGEAGSGEAGSGSEGGSGEAGSGEAGSGESGETGPGVDDAGLDDGCNCSAANDTKGGFLASLLGLGLLGFTRRRRRRRD